MELLLVWKHPRTRARYRIGFLQRTEGRYAFRYDLAHPRSLSDAKAAGFRVLDSFPHEDQLYSAVELFPTFSRRLPPEWSNDLFVALGLEPGDDLEYLARTGGRVPTDTLEFLEPVNVTADGSQCQLHFPIAGWRHYGGESVIGALSVGTPLGLKLEGDNEYDSSAIAVFSPDQTKLGYVPSVYSYFIDAWVESGNYQAVVEQIGPIDDPQVRVMVDFTAGTEGPGGLERLPDGLEAYAAALLDKQQRKSAA